jgi:hypothetical protein
MQNILEVLSTVTTSKFASFTYRSKTDGSLARYTVILGATYLNTLEKSKTALEIEMESMDASLLPAAQAVMESLDKSIAAHKAGTQSDDYTKKGQYQNIGGGVNLNSNDNSIQIFGLLHSKVVLEEGVRKEVKSAPFTILKNQVRKLLPISKFREFAFDIGNIQTVKLNGDTFEFVCKNS